METTDDRVHAQHAHGEMPRGQVAPRGGGDNVGGGDDADGHDHAAMLRKWIWRDFVNILLGIWLIASPFTMGYLHTSPRMAWSDVLSGAAIVVLGVMTLSLRFDLARWGICFTGIWLLFAPLVFWTPAAGAYNNDTLIGALPRGGKANRCGGHSGSAGRSRATEGPIPAIDGGHRTKSLATRIIAAMDSNNVPWNMLVSAALGVWIMCAPSALGVSERAADSDPLGLWLIAAPWILTGDNMTSRWNDVFIGIALIVLSLRRGTIKERFAGWNRYLI